MKYFKWLFSAAVLVSSFPGLANDYEVVDIDSKVLGEQRQYQVLLPEDYFTTSQNYPVIYRLDGADNIPLMKEVLGRLKDADAAPDVIIVAIENTDRLRDMYPTVNQDKNGPVGIGGGAKNIRNYLGPPGPPKMGGKIW